MNEQSPAPRHGPVGRRPILTALAVESGIGVVAGVLGFIFGVPAAATLHVEPRAIAIGIAATLPMLAFFAVFVLIDLPALSSLRDVLDRFTEAVFGRASTVEIAAVAAAAGIGEELLFRGFLQALLVPVLGGPGALAAASIAFGLAHAVTAAYVVIATVFGAYLGWLWMATGNLVVPITAHAVYDFAALVMMVSANRRRASAVRDRIAN